MNEAFDHSECSASYFSRRQTKRERGRQTGKLIIRQKIGLGRFCSPFSNFHSHIFSSFYATNMILDFLEMTLKKKNKIIKNSY
jgi:hypothetical protein